MDIKAEFEKEFRLAEEDFEGTVDLYDLIGIARNRLVERLTRQAIQEAQDFLDQHNEAVNKMHFD